MSLAHGVATRTPGRRDGRNSASPMVIALKKVAKQTKLWLCLAKKPRLGTYPLVQCRAVSALSWSGSVQVLTTAAHGGMM